MTEMIINSVSEYCTNLLSTSKCRELPFHNLDHTKEVVQNVKYLCAAMDINLADTDLLLIAAWFHDTGFSKTYKNHEAESKRIAKKFLLKLGMESEKIATICACIEATKMPQGPTTELEEILCDADIFHLSNSHFFYKILLLRRENAVVCDNEVIDSEWYKLTLEFLKKHYFRSVYGRGVLEQGREDNIHKVKNILDFYKK